MPIGQQQNRPVTAFTIDVATLTGKILTVDNIVHGGDHTDGTYTAVALGGGSGAGATADVVVSGGAVTTVTIVAQGTGYLDTDTGLTISNGVIGGAANATVDVATVLGEVATVTVTAGGTGWVTGDVISAGELNTDGGGSGLAGTIVAAAGVATGFTVTAGGTGYAVADTQSYIGTGEVGVAGADYIDHDEYELGGVVSEYTTADQASYKPEIPPNVLGAKQVLVKTVLKADQPQLKVQKKYIDSGSVTVWAEPTLVDSNGNVVGNNVRAEEVTDEARCTALGFTWTTATTGDGGTGSYGYCTETVAFAATLDQTECITNGYLFDYVADACVNSDGTDEAVLEAYLNGGAGDLYADDKKAAICKAHGHFWDGSACVAFPVEATFTAYGTKTLCNTNGGIWIAGVCYSPEVMGNGQGGDFSETVGKHNKVTVVSLDD